MDRCGRMLAAGFAFAGLAGCNEILGLNGEFGVEDNGGGKHQIFDSSTVLLNCTGSEPAICTGSFPRGLKLSSLADPRQKVFFRLIRSGMDTIDPIRKSPFFELVDLKKG